MEKQINIPIFPLAKREREIGEAKPAFSFLVSFGRMRIAFLFFLILILGKSEISFSQELSNTGAIANITSGTVVSGGTVTITSGTITNDGTLTLSSHLTNNGTVAGNGSYNIAGNFTNNSVFTAGTSTVTFNGAAPQTIGGTTTTSFSNIIQSNAVGVSLAHDANLTNILTVSSGTFTTTSYSFTFTSDASGTASIAALTGGAAIAGNITMQRYAPGSMNTDDWRFLSSAINGAKISDWTDDFATSGFPGSTDPGNSFVSIYTYDETALGNSDQGYTAPGSTADGLNGKGFWVYLGPTPVTFDVTGPPNMGDQTTIPVTYTNGGTGDPTNDGWNLVPNPYPCTIDWDAVTDGTHWTKTNVGGTIYIWNSSTGSYSTYSAGNPVNGGSNLIASQQAFYIQTNGAPTFAIRELCKSPTYNSPLFKTGNSLNTSHIPMAFKDYPIPLNTNNTPNSIKFTASGNGYPEDEMLIRFMQGATNNFDFQYDGWKLPGTYSNLSSVIQGDKNMSINCLPLLTSDLAIPIRLTIPTCNCTATYSIRRDSILMLPTSSCIILEDKTTGNMVDLRSAVSYTFTISDTTQASRFILHISAPLSKKAINPSCSNSNNGKAIARGTGTGPWDYVWKNSAGTIVQTTTGSLTADTLFNCAPGIYSINVSGATCGLVTDTIIIKAPAILSNIISQTANVSCFGGNNGSATVSVSGGTPGYSYLWDNGQSTSLASDLSFGNYALTITDAQGCTSTASVTIGQPSAITNSVVPINVSCFGGNDGSTMVSSSGGTPGYSYLWASGQSASSISNLPFGDYAITITDAQGCTSTASVTIAQPTAITNSVVPINVSCFGGNDGSTMVSSSGGTPGYSYLWASGQSASSISNLPFGDYAITITDAQGCTSTASVTIAQPTAITNSVVPINVSCFGENNGSVTIFSSGGVPGYSYLWDNGQSISLISNLSAGNYSVTATDLNGCTAASSVVITQPALVTAGYTASSYTVDIASGSSVVFTNTSSGAAAYQWNFGDASGTDVSLNPIHSYSSAGTYTVTLISSNGPCSDTAYATIVVVNSNPTGLNGNQSSANINVAYENGQVFLLFLLNKETKVNISVYNMIGEEVFSQNNLLVKNEKIKLNFPPSSIGVYIAVSEMNDAIISKKIFISRH